jgi:uncharacterized damage-inducible protein DinB
MSDYGIKDHFARLTEYNYWANEKLSNRILELDEETIVKQVNSSFPSIKETLLHISDAEQMWLSRVKGNPLDEWPSKSFEGTKEILIHHFLTPSISWKRYISELDDGGLTQQFTYQNSKGKEFSNKVADAVTQVMNHSTYHRGQLASIFHQLEETNIPQTDFIKYQRDME